MNRDGHIAIVGTGLIGMGWSIVFARAGWNVRLYDNRDGAASDARDLAEARLGDLVDNGMLAEVRPVIDRIAVAQRLEDALDGALYVQESVLERLDVKRAVFSQIDQHLGATAIVGSSSSGIPASAYTDHIAAQARCLVVHPVNPPYLVPVVELVPAPWTAKDTLSFARELMLDVGQAPITLSREIDGFVLNRLQGVLLMEAWKLYEDGIASLADIDLTVSEGLGLRWSFMGPFETIDLNAPGGIGDYARRLGPLSAGIAASRKEFQPWQEPLIGQVESELHDSHSLAEIAQRTALRDQRLMALMKHKNTVSSRRND